MNMKQLKGELEMKDKWILVYAILIVPIMMATFCFFGQYNNRYINYFVPYGVYLLILLLGVILFSKGNQSEKTVEKKSLLLYISFIPAVATFFVAFLPTLSQMTGNLLALTVVYAIINGTLEELFWRYTFNKVFDGKLVFSYVIPTIIFTCWHFALVFANGITYHGGMVALVGGAGFMGALWGFVMYKTRNIKVLVLAHVCTNFFAFSQLIVQNFGVLINK